MIGDPHHIRVLAARLRADGERVRAVAVRVAGTSEVAWQSPAAQSFRARVHDVAVGLRRVATDLDDAALALDWHATALESVAAALARAAAAGESAVRAGAHELSAVLR
ncbi:hypothetical protein [Nostocoides sp. HKS02]|uniref:hypothetical protein n=1 Tax=Nostocoides sp. HKS02 TaxID=1813880 RepID=UPI0012B4FE5E|nr:hypothetical protein [Tetrasphaera sp. HKS02]QGN58311.1 hypothetical protein GKE56_10920 [Tetrasphaera sp. HKS02]